MPTSLPSLVLVRYLTNYAEKLMMSRMFHAAKMFQMLAHNEIVGYPES